jgi:Na+/melibiose symporter-like transporter
MQQEEDERFKRAQTRVRRIRGFYSNVITFVLVNLLLLIINLITSPHNLWFYWVTLIWGVILIIQAINLFTIRDHFLGEEWEKKKIQDLMEKEKNKKS